MIGRRRLDTSWDHLPTDIQRGDYWRVLDPESEEPAQVNEPGNLTRSVYMVVAPIGEGDAYAIGTLTKHTVREEDDGTISVRPGDGSSNSILITGAHGQQYHGFIEKGVWTPNG